MQNTVQSTNVLFPEDEIVYISDYTTAASTDPLTTMEGKTWTNLGAISEFSRESKIETQQPPSQNVEHEQVISKMAETINVTIQELNMTNYNKLMGQIAQSQSVAGTTTSVGLDTYVSGSYSTGNKFIKLANQNWSTAGTLPGAPLSFSITGASSSSYTDIVDYKQAIDAYGDYGFIINSTGVVTSTGIRVNYTYLTKTKSVLYHGGADELIPCALKVYSIYADGRTILAYYPRVEYISGGSITDKGGASGEFKDMKFTLEAREHDNYTYSGRKQYKIEVQTTA